MIAEKKIDWRNLSPKEREKQVAKIEKERKKPTSISTGYEIKDNLKTGVVNLGKGTADLTKGLIELTKGIIEETDALALGLGAVALITIGELSIAPTWAMFSEKTLGVTTKEVFKWSKNPNIARVVGYPLLAVAGGYGAWRIEQMLQAK